MLNDVLRLFGNLITIFPMLFKEIRGSLEGLFLLGCLKHFWRILLYKWCLIRDWLILLCFFFFQCCSRCKYVGKRTKYRWWLYFKVHNLLGWRIWARSFDWLCLLLHLILSVYVRQYINRGLFEDRWRLYDFWQVRCALCINCELFFDGHLLVKTYLRRYYSITSELDMFLDKFKQRFAQFVFQKIHEAVGFRSWYALAAIYGKF